MAFIVTHIVDGDTVRVSPKWKWLDIYGDQVKVEGYSSSALTKDFLVEKLIALLRCQVVELRNPKGVFNNILHCSVFLNDVDVAQYFPEVSVS